jgi:hypothetical protein
MPLAWVDECSRDEAYISPIKWLYERYSKDEPWAPVGLVAEEPSLPALDAQQQAQYDVVLEEIVSVDWTTTSRRAWIKMTPLLVRSHRQGHIGSGLTDLSS